MRPIEDRGLPSASHGASPSASRADPPEGVRAPLWASPWARAGLVLLGVLAADQLSKRVVEHSIVRGEERKLLPGVQLVNTRNHGVAFGFFPGSHLGVTILIAVALLVLMAYFALHAAQPLIWLPTGMLVGGALGNIIDRLRDGAVTDFIKLPLGWPPFNLADSSITIGILILFLLVDHSRHGAR
jgi:signal peptidase II